MVVPECSEWYVLMLGLPLKNGLLLDTQRKPEQLINSPLTSIKTVSVSLDEFLTKNGHESLKPKSSIMNLFFRVEYFPSTERWISIRPNNQNTGRQ